MRMYTSTSKWLQSAMGLAVATAVIGVLTGYIIGHIAGQRDQADRVIMSGWVADPDGDLASDGEGWDVGNFIARDGQGRLLFNLDSLSGDPYRDCVDLLDTRQVRFPDSVTFASVDICKVIGENR